MGILGGIGNAIGGVLTGGLIPGLGLLKKLMAVK